jgi:hypothetical protein
MLRPSPSARALGRRAILALPMLALPGLARAMTGVPPFPLWVGRTALLAGDGGAARLLLTADGTGLMSVRFLLFCRALPIRHWEVQEDGMSVRYTRASALDPRRLIAGEAYIVPGDRQLLWIEAARHLAHFEGFATPEAAQRCA